MAAGKTTKDIAVELTLTVNTVRSYPQALMEKLGAHTRVQAIGLARKGPLPRARMSRGRRAGRTSGRRAVCAAHRSVSDVMSDFFAVRVCHVRLGVVGVCQ